MFQPTPVFARLLVLALGVSLAGGPVRAAAAEPFEINAILPLTGGAAFLGKEEAQTLAVIEESVNKAGGIGGRSIKFTIADDQSNPQVAVQLTNGVIEKKVSVILGSSLVSTCSAMTALVKDGPVLYCFSPGIHPPKDSYAFSSSVSTKDLIAVLVGYFRQRGWKRLAIITSIDATGQDAERSMDEAFSAPENKSVQVVAREHFNTTDVSVTAQMTHIRAANPQALIAWSTGTPAATLLRGVNEARLTIPVATTNGNLTYAQMKQYAQFLPKELYFPGVPFAAPGQVTDRATKAAVEAFYKAFEPAGIKPDLGQSLAWDPTLLVIDALRKLGTNATAAQIRQYLNDVHGWVGSNGPYDFRAVEQRGLGRSAALVVRWDPAKETWVGVSRPGGAPLK